MSTTGQRPASIRKGRAISRRLVLAGAPAVAAAYIRPASAQVANVNFWDMLWGPAPQYPDAARALIAQFNRENPNIQVTYRSVPWANWYQTYVTAISAGTAPDISTGGGFQAVQLFEMGGIRPLDDFIDELRQAGELSDFAPGLVETQRWNGHHVALPWGVDIRVWFYRKDHFAERGVAVPSSWAELREAAKRLTTGDRYGIVAAGDSRGGHYIFNAMLNNGGGLFTPQAELALLSDPKNREGLEALSAMARDGSIHPASPGYTNADTDRAFLQGQASMVLATPSFVDRAPELADKIGVVPPMTGPSGTKGTILFSNGVMIYQQTRQPEATKTFLRWWSKNQKPLWTQGANGNLPARASIANDPFFTGNAPKRYIIENYVPIGKMMGTHAPGVFPKLNTVDGEGTLHVLAQQIWQKRDLGQAMTEADRRLRDVLR
jgi:multiple sugar transport system substrate-binding protein